MDARPDQLSGSHEAPARSPGRAPRVVYFSLERLRPSQASYTHVHVIAGGLEAEGVPTRLVAVKAGAEQPSRSRLGRLASYVNLTWRALRALNDADIAYLRAHPAAIVFSLIARLRGKPVIHEVNGRTEDIGVTYRLPKGVTQLLNALQIVQYRWAAGLIAVTPGLQDWLASLLGSDAKLHLVPNGADGKRFHPAATGGPVIEGQYALFFGGLVAWHGIDTMLAALRHQDWPEGIKLVIAGDGPGGPEVRAAARHETRLIAPGYLPSSELAGLAARAFVILCPIDNHGSRNLGGVAPLKLFEGMASGRPVIATDLPFQAELVRAHQCGLVIPPADPAALAGAVRTLVGDAHLADDMGRNGRRAVETEFDWRYRVTDTVAVVRGVFAAHAR
ncbi:glycosyltransferase family 4 protein [Bosea sp. BK604]|uniref:glycosyltransferase family 4 protein n=1 Tax=Bosea sp. BK604 TaxID=2512180 RepID=UPI0010539BAC|nr:glycosyltransferase family 4 protein [Bosea sp. BK604]TCR70053.1 glycosyltransferase involved in cell wall biosynthesis [Bosea sp. BK604]